MVDLVGIEPTASSMPTARLRETPKKMRAPGFHGSSVQTKNLKDWWTWSGSNRRPLPCHGSALPTAPQAHKRWTIYIFAEHEETVKQNAGESFPKSY